MDTMVCAKALARYPEGKRKQLLSKTTRRGLLSWKDHNWVGVVERQLWTNTVGDSAAGAYMTACTKRIGKV